MCSSDLWLRRLHDRSQVTTIFVTHDQSEALQVADTVVVMNEGRIEQIGTPSAIYDQPANPFVTEFISRVNILPSSSNIFQPKGLETTESQLLEPSSDLVTKQYLYTKM